MLSRVTAVIAPSTTVVVAVTEFVPSVTVTVVPAPYPVPAVLIVNSTASFAVFQSALMSASVFHVAVATASTPSGAEMVTEGVTPAK